METITQQVIARAQQLLEIAMEMRTKSEIQQANQLGRMMEDQQGRALTFAMVDQVFRSQTPAKVASRWRRIIDTFGIPRYLGWWDRWLFKLGSIASRFAPRLVMNGVRSRLRSESASVILNGETEALHQHLALRKAQGFRINLNHLGEAILGEAEAQRRLQTVLDDLADPAIDYVSVKISAIFSQINLTAREHTLEQLCDRLRLLYRVAMPQQKFVNLDMEEYRDLGLTLSAFCRILDEPEFQQLEAGIVLQAYLPDSWAAQQQLTAWAQRRRANGGAGIKLRLVKGANLAMEQVEAELHGWEAAPYHTKLDTDANFRRMLEFACQPEHAAAVRVGVASHNLFDVALAMVLREQNGVAERIELEMLEGMAPHQARAVKQSAGSLLLYAPAVEERDFLSAMAYLVRRLDENTAPDNFLRELFALTPNSPAWERQKELFLAGWERRHTVASTSYRAQSLAKQSSSFANQPDTDWTQASSQDELLASQSKYQPSLFSALLSVDEVLATAQAAQTEWEQRGPSSRAALLLTAADIMQAERFATLAYLRHEGKKVTLEADAEISEAIDFARYYAAHQFPPQLNSQPLGVVVITPPWNFPYAIPAGGILAALMAGNTVILKPAPEVQQIAQLLVHQLWRAGIPRDVLQFYPCADGETGRTLLCDPRVSCVVLTGAYETARLFQSWRPNLTLFAETSGKNALIVTAMADRDLAIKDLVRSAFGHAGQKCSAASLAILEAEVYDDPNFRRQLRDAANSLAVGSALQPWHVVTPLIREPSPALLRALTTLEPGEEWLLEPVVNPADPCSWSPGIKLGVQPGSWFHRTECFGPVLGLMRAETLTEAIAWQNATPFGLTAGIHSLDENEIELWRDSVQAGNLYVNRPITGAIVQRQPFGGWKRSCIGPGAKAGGPNYVDLFRTYSEQQLVALESAQQTYQHAWDEHFSREHDYAQLTCESNHFRYRPCRGVILRLPFGDEQLVARAELAAQLCGVSLTISLASVESDEQFIARLPALAQHAEFLRTIGPVADSVLAAAHQADLNWINAPITSHGMLELRYWLREQSISQTRHRYGQIMPKMTR
jgi:RHH-type transcriptional regulator, proline utilization regulon repressor / proline dehydrogenase / delta 1-pyrroline-5-carboxylate dehydrogenase